MNHTYRKSSLALVALLALTGCRSGAVESAETVAPEETPAVTPAKAADDGTEATPASVGLTQAMLDELAKGYQMESTVVTTSMDGDTASYQSWALECAATDGKYSAKSWELCETEVPTKNAVDQFFYATYDPSEATKNTYSVKLGINNKLVYTPIKDSNGDVQVWEKGGFSNFWADLSISDFDYTDEDNTFSLYAYDIYSNCTASTGCVVYASFLTVEEFDGAVTAYKAKLVAAGYTASATAGKHGGVVYTKAITIKDSSNADVAYTLSLEVYPRKLTFMGVNLTMLYLYPTATIVKA
jgi:hypothetical protein